MAVIGIVSATRATYSDFWGKTPLGISLSRLGQDTRLNACIAYENRRGLSEIYNEAIDAEFAHDYLVFIHDDVWIEDVFFCEHVIAGCETYDVIGIAGNQARAQGQVSWAFLSDLKWDLRENLTGRLGFGAQPFGSIDFFGPVPARCELLDGVFLAAKKATLRQSKVRFDIRFAFDFYDMDFCRTATSRGLRLGTWCISMTHASGGSYATQRWIDGHKNYIDKWGG
jgi:hypothetical protein